MSGTYAMKKLIILNKKEGETPLEALGGLRKKNRKYRDLKMTYAGRLDPMASGLLLVLFGDEVKKKERYLALGKEYEFEVLFGFATDTYDALGKVTDSGVKKAALKDLQKAIKDNLGNFTGKFTQAYPRYSSKAVEGKQLWQIAREGREIEIPEREVSVKKLKLLKIRKITAKKLLENIEKRIKKIKGDFRQEEILKIWRKSLSRKEGNFPVASFHIRCGSGTYVRGIADALGKRIGMPALAFRIKRTKIGKFVKI